MQQIVRSPTGFVISVVLECRCMNNVHASFIAIAESIDPSKSLSHAFVRRQITDKVISGNVDADFASARADQVDSTTRNVYARRTVIGFLESLKDLCLDKIIAFAAS